MWDNILENWEGSAMIGISRVWAHKLKMISSSLLLFLVPPTMVSVSKFNSSGIWLCYEPWEQEYLPAPYQSLDHPTSGILIWRVLTKAKQQQQQTAISKVKHLQKLAPCKDSGAVQWLSRESRSTPETGQCPCTSHPEGPEKVPGPSQSLDKRRNQGT